MARPLQYRRLVVTAFLLGIAFVALGYRLVDLQVWQHEKLLALAHKNTKSTIQREPRRGDIRDIRGNLLATSIDVKTVCADPVLIGPRQTEVARVLAPLLKTNEAYLIERLQPRVLRQNTNGEPIFDRYVVLKRKVRIEEWEQIQKTMEQLFLESGEKKLSRAQHTFNYNLRSKAIFPEDDQLRMYPNETLAAHVLGFVGVVERDTSRGRVIETVGKYGVEDYFNSKLQGVGGWRQTETDRNKREVVAFRGQDVAPRPGLNVVLTLDAGLQNIVESELTQAMEKHTPISAMAVVVRPRTGEILALANVPNFDPNQPGSVPQGNLRNRLISDIAEPGSTFKIVVVSAALNEQIVTLNEQFDCENGVFHFAGYKLHDHHPYGVLSVENIITKSSNIGAAKIGIKMGQAQLYEYMRNFGFGTPTGLPLAGEGCGIVHPLGKWNKLSISRIPMGHEVAVTPLQMIMAMCAIANQGQLMRPMLIDRLEDEQGRVVAKYQPQFVRQVIRPETARQMVAALKTVVSTNGTAPHARLQHYQVAGKTGTAQKPGPGGYLPGKYYSSFIGFFPADDPELCISVVFDEPKQGHYGGETAAPVFHDIAERAANYLSIRPPPVPASPPVPAQSETVAGGRATVTLMQAQPKRTLD